jgi:hypothetical protein
MEGKKMNDAFRMIRAVYELMFLMAKRPRPSDWEVPQPPAKRVRFMTFEDDGAKAVKLPDVGTVVHVK